MAQSPIDAWGQRLRSRAEGGIEAWVQRSNVSRCSNLILLFLSRLCDNTMSMKFDL